MGRSNGIRVIDNAPTISLEANFNAPEAIGSRPVVVTRTGDLSSTNVVPYAVIPMTAGVLDYTASALGAVTFAPSDTTKTIPLTIIDDLIIEITESFIVELGADAANWIRGNNRTIISIIDNDLVGGSIMPLTRVNAFEIPYGMLSGAQRTAAAGNNGGYVGFAVSRPDFNTPNYAVYSSTTSNGTYTKIADNISYSPYADLISIINFEHPNLPFINEFDLPGTLSANTIALIQDTAGQQELCAVSAYSTITISGVSNKFFTNVKGAVYHTLPIAVGNNDTASIQLLNNYAIDTNLKANAATVFYKIVPKDNLGTELALSSITPISITINGYANKPYRPAFVRFGNSSAVADLVPYPTEPLIRGDIYMAIAPASRIDETTPYGWFNPSGLNETGVLYKCDIYGADGTVVRTIDYDPTTRLFQYTLGMQYADVPINDRQYSVYALQGAVRSIENKIRVNQNVVDQGDISSVAIAQSGSGASGNLLVTVTFDRTLYVPIAMDYALSGTVISTNAYGTITLGANASFIELNRIQATPGIASFVMTIPLVSAVGKTLTIDIGIIDVLYTRTATITVVT